MTTYIAGPMTGHEDQNRQLFDWATEVYRSAGHAVINPHETNPGVVDDDHPHDYFLRKALKDLVDCDHIVMLPGWHESKGARLEHHVASELGMEVTYLEER